MRQTPVFHQTALAGKGHQSGVSSQFYHHNKGHWEKRRHTGQDRQILLPAFGFSRKAVLYEFDAASAEGLLDMAKDNYKVYICKN